MTGSLVAGELPTLQDKPWLGCFVGHEGRGFDFALGADGKSEIHFKKGSKRISVFSYFPVTYILEEQVNGKWVSRQIKEDGFETNDKPTEEPEKVTFIVTYTGDTKLEVTHEFDSGEVTIGTKLASKTTENPLRWGVRVTVPDLFRNIKEDDLSERELKKKVDAEVTGETVKGQRVKADLYEKPKLDGPDYFGDGAKTISFESDKIAGRELVLSTVDEDAGSFEIRQTKDAYHGFNIFWWPDAAKSASSDGHLLLKVK
jgi:hypothetical protein